jgi:NitT/TauT family transport system ATP-binding protein
MFPGQLSGGMQQRVGIARALSIEPDLLLMDEPFSHLDAITARDLRAELQRLWLDTGSTILFVTHDVLEAVLLSSRVLMMSSQGVIFRDLTIDLPFPRRQTDRDVAIHQAEILALFEEMERPTVDA